MDFKYYSSLPFVKQKHFEVEETYLCQLTVFVVLLQHGLCISHFEPLIFPYLPKNSSTKRDLMLELTMFCTSFCTPFIVPTVVEINDRSSIPFAVPSIFPYLFLNRASIHDSSTIGTVTFIIRR